MKSWCASMQWLVLDGAQLTVRVADKVPSRSGNSGQGSASGLPPACSDCSHWKCCANSAEGLSNTSNKRSERIAQNGQRGPLGIQALGVCSDCCPEAFRRISIAQS